jgi:hypothetical protein
VGWEDFCHLEVGRFGGFQRDLRGWKRGEIKEEEGVEGDQGGW